MEISEPTEVTDGSRYLGPIEWTGQLPARVLRERGGKAVCRWCAIVTGVWRCPRVRYIYTNVPCYFRVGYQKG
jgi:hypothetical protein